MCFLFIPVQAAYICASSSVQKTAIYSKKHTKITKTNICADCVPSVIALAVVVNDAVNAPQQVDPTALAANLRRE
jgi:hypothetical protein